MTSAASSAAPRADHLWLLGLCIARMGSAAPFQMYAAVLPVVQVEWGMSGKRAGGLAFVWQLTFATSLIVLSTLADRVGPRVVFVWSAWATAAAVALVPFIAQGYSSGLLAFALVALVNGGTYTPGLMLLSGRVPPARRGRAIGWFLGAASVGYTVGLFLTGALLPRFGWRGAVLVIAAFSALTAMAPSFLLRGRTAAATAPAHEAGLLRGFLTNRPALLISTGYTFHSWETLGMWTWTPAFVTAALSRSDTTVAPAALAATLAASFHLIGLFASGAGGWLSDRWGRTTVILGMLIVSAFCSFTFGWLIAAPIALLTIVGTVYFFSAVGDSSAFSAGFTELVDARILGASFALRSLVGFGAGAIASLLFGYVLDLTNPGAGPGEQAVWGWAFTTLGAGAVLGILATLWLRLSPESLRMADGKR